MIGTFISLPPLRVCFVHQKRFVFSFDITLIYYFIIAAHKINDLSFFPASTSKSQSIKIKNQFSDAIIRTQCGSSIQIVSNKKKCFTTFHWSLFLFSYSNSCWFLFRNLYDFIHSWRCLEFTRFSCLQVSIFSRKQRQTWNQTETLKQHHSRMRPF